MVAFMHIPKTGGKSVGAVLASLLKEAHGNPAQITFVRPGAKKLRLPPPPPRGVRRGLVRGHYEFSPLDKMMDLLHGDVWATTILRHPVQYHLSNWRYKRTPRGAPPKRLASAAGWAAPLREFAVAPHPEDGWNDQTAWVAGAARGFATSALPPGVVEAMRRNGTSMLAAAMRNLDRFGWVGVLDHWDASMAVLRHSFGLQARHTSVTPDMMGSSPWVDPEAEHDPVVHQQLACRSLLDMQLFFAAEDRLEREVRACGGCYDLVALQLTLNRTRPWRLTHSLPSN